MNRCCARHLAWISFATCALASTPARADDRPAGADAVRLLRAADSAIRNSAGFHYRATAWGEGAAATAFPKTTAEVWIARSTSAQKPRFRIERTDPAPTQTYTCDGARLLVIEEGGKRYAEFDASAAEHGDAYTLLLMRELLLPEPFEEEMAAGKVREMYRAKTGDAECDVLEVRYGDGQRAEWWIGVTDRLPHRVVRVITGGSGALSGFVLELSKIETVPSFPEDQFAVTKPAGRALRVLPVGWSAPDWALKSPDGQETRLSAKRGRVVVLDFWSVWCVPCRIAMPELMRITTAFKDRPVDVLGINTWEKPPNDPARFAKDNGLNYTILLQGDRVAEAYQIGGIPALFVIGPDGRILYSTAGPGHEQEITDAVNRGLTQLAPAKPTSTNRAAP